MPSPLLQDGAVGLAEGPDLTRYLLVCVALIAAIAGIGWGLRRLLAVSLKSRAARRSLRVVDVLPLGGRQKLAVVRCYDRTFVLGVGEKEVGLVAELDADVEEHGEDEVAPAARDAAAFEELLEETPPPARLGGGQGVLG